MVATVSNSPRGFQGAVLKLMRASDFVLTVTGRTEVSEHYLRLGFDAGGLFQAHDPHPTMWLRLWFPAEKPHQRAYTLVNPNVDDGTFDLEFALHDGFAADWAQSAQVGDTISATLLGSKYDLPETRPDGYVVVGDLASLPAVNSLLSSIGDAPATVFLEWTHESDRELPVSTTSTTTVTWVERKGEGAALVEAVTSAAFDAPGHHAWVACDTKTTRAVSAVLKSNYGIVKKAIKAQGYWIP
ncbi:putative siderophore-interacting protein [Rhodococcoides trifolii]|uniref:Siderophore-interacting protein n=1 Tax=Rhodococcoides trifolii TaxID=908250 RepID=A0A917CUQ5_9NOCA|nr:siderophore-interacting protein [Rhodococcus trifolii]GGF98349.1 putative siderophore-interacting protein [Rhodococcus trifolii]